MSFSYSARNYGKDFVPDDNVNINNGGADNRNSLLDYF